VRELRILTGKPVERGIDFGGGGSVRLQIGIVARKQVAALAGFRIRERARQTRPGPVAAIAIGKLRCSPR